LDKNVKGNEMGFMARRTLIRKAQNKESAFRVRKRPVPPEKIYRYIQRKGVSEEAVMSQPSPAAGEDAFTLSYITADLLA
jgi:hypothetical protein